MSHALLRPFPSFSLVGSAIICLLRSALCIVFLYVSQWPGVIVPLTSPHNWPVVSAVLPYTQDAVPITVPLFLPLGFLQAHISSGGKCGSRDGQASGSKYLRFDHGDLRADPTRRLWANHCQKVCITCFALPLLSRSIVNATILPRKHWEAINQLPHLSHNMVIARQLFQIEYPRR